MATAPDPTVIAAVPNHLRVLRAQIDEHAPSFASTATLRWTLLTLLDAAEFAAKQLVALVPLAAAVEGRGPQQLHAPLSERPRVPRVVEEAPAGADPRLPPGRPHP